MRITIDDDRSKKYKKYKKKRIRKTKPKSVKYEHELDSPVKKSDYNFSAYGRRMTSY